MKIISFCNSGWADFQKAPVCVFKSIPFTWKNLLCYRLVLALLVKTCQDLESPVLCREAQLLVLRQPILPEFNIYGARLGSCQRKTQSLIKKYRAVRVTRSLTPCRGHAPAELHLGHYATFAGLHPAQNIMFQHHMEPEIPRAQRKLRYSNF